MVGRRRGEAWMVALPAADLGIGPALSPATARAVAELVERVVALCTTP